MAAACEAAGHRGQTGRLGAPPGPADGYFMRAHTITVLIFLIGCLVYVGLIEDATDGDLHSTEYNTKRGLVGALYFWLALGMTIMPDGPFSRPHPVIWRLIFAMSIIYELILIFMLFQSPHDARQLLKHIDPSLGEPIPEKDYGGNCRIYDWDRPDDPYHNLKESSVQDKKKERYSNLAK